MLNFFKKLFGQTNKQHENNYDAEHHAVFDMPFSLLVSSLKKQGFTFGIDSFEQMHFVVQHAVKTEQTHRLHWLLCALLAQNDEQQHIFMETYKRVMLPMVEKKEPETRKIKEKPQHQQPAELLKQGEHTPRDQTKQTPVQQQRKKVVASLRSCPSNEQFVKAFPEIVQPIAENKWIRLSRRLRYTQKTGRLIFDVEKTIAKVINNAGRAIPQFSATRKHAEYLFLIDKYNDRDHQAQWHNQLYNLLVQNNINVTRFYFDHSPQICRNEKFTKGISLREILNRYEHAILFLFADGMQFINAYTKTLYPWTSIFANWQLRLFFSTVAPTLWGKREKILAELFTLIVPYNAAGLSAINQYLDENANAESFAIPYWTQNPEINQTAIDTSELMEQELEIYYDATLIRWIAACAVYPELNWNLTIALGNELSTTKQALHTAQNIKQLVRLDWFVKGRIPDKWRLRLIKKYLTKPDIAQINRFLYKQLDANKPLSDTPGYNNYMLQLGIHDLLAETNEIKVQQKAQKLNQKLEKTGRLRDIVNLHIINEEDDSPIYFELTQKQLQNLGINLAEVLQEPEQSFTSYTETATSVTFEMVAIKGGTFTMGSPKSEPQRSNDEVQHEVSLSDFYMGKYEVTQAEYQVIMGKNPSHFKGDNLPVEQVSWYDAVEFCNKLSEKAGLPPYYNIDKNTKDSNNKNSSDDVKWIVSINKDAKGYRLPTEAEWEYAARGGNHSTRGHAPLSYSGSNNIDEVAWYDYNSGDETHPIGEKKPNELGIYDMSGNVKEWCYDWFGKYEKGKIKNPQGDETGSRRVNRGGSFEDDVIECCVVFRQASRPFYCIPDFIGFRLALSL